MLAVICLHPLAAVAQTVEELPPVVVEGATLAAPKVKAKPAPKSADAAPAKKTPATAPDAADGDGGGASGAAPADAEASPDGDTPATVETGVEADKIGSAVSVVTAREIEARQVRDVADALRGLPGVSVSRQGVASNLAVVRIRGAESNHTLVLIDGVEVNSVGNDGFFDFSNVRTEDIAQIEVIRGPQGGLYGSGAIGGVVNIVTKSGKGPLTLRVQGEGGRYDSRNGAAQLSGGDDRAYGSITVAKQQSDGFNISTLGDERDASEFASVSLRGGVQPLDGVTVDGTLRLSRNDGDRDGFGIDAAGFFVPVDDRSTFESDLWVGRLQVTIDPFDGLWTQNVYVKKSELDQVDFDRSLFPSVTRGVSENFDYGYKTTLKLETDALPHVRHFLTGLVEREEESFVQPTGDDILRERGRLSTVGEARGEYFDALFLTGTVRHDANEVFDDFTTWHVSGSLKMPETPVRLHASAGTGVKYPTFSEQFGFFFGFIPNPALIPEESFGWDAGAELTFLGGRASLDVTYFEANLKNEIDTFLLPLPACGSLPFCFTTANREGESNRKGVEVTGRLVVTDGVTLGGAYTFLDATDDAGRHEVRRPMHSGRADLDLAFAQGAGHFNLAAVYNGRTRDVAGNIFDFTIDRATLDDYWLLTAAASYRIAPGVELFGRVENLLDDDYQEVFGFETAAIAAFAGVRVTMGGDALVSAAPSGTR